MTKSATRVAADKATFTQAEVTAKDTAARAGRKNWIINGGMQVSQRGDYTSATSAPDGYYLDRWRVDVNAVTANIQQLTTTVDGGTVKTMKIIATSSATGALQAYQLVEDFAALAGRTLTFSARVKSNHSSTRLQIYDGVSFIDNAGSRHTGGGDWENLSLTFTPSNSATTLGARITGYDGLISLATGDYIEFTNVQLELGSVATDFEHRSYGEILADCQRYFERINTEDSYGFFASGTAYDSNTGTVGLVYTTKRAKPTLTFSSVSHFKIQHGTTGMVVTNFASIQYGLDRALVDGNGVSGLTQNSGVILISNNAASAYIEIDAEL
jgi:hypothetical protein